METSSVSFVFNAFMIWGKVLATEKAVAKSPMNVNNISAIHHRMFIMFFMYNISKNASRIRT